MIAAEPPVSGCWNIRFAALFCFALREPAQSSAHQMLSSFAESARKTSKDATL